MAKKKRRKRKKVNEGHEYEVIIVLEINGLDVFYGDYQALFNIQATVESGEIVSLLGANGAGKTTTINTVCGFIRPRAGTIRFEGSKIHQMSPNKIVKEGLIQIPEERMLFSDMTVLENLQMGAYLGRAREKLADSLDWVYGLFPILKTRKSQSAGTLSGGEQQMLAIGRGLMSLPRLLILDEPSLGLAPMLVAEVFQVIRKINQEGVAILLVEQNAHQSLKISNRAYLLENGSIAMDGRASELLETEYIRESYLGI
ncbi:MAG: ABC transporter ATP-binding protein [Desulfobacterales bacterium]|nr:ABC transporter ATP-binding protein [Desulfobacterales bacterium]